MKQIIPSFLILVVCAFSACNNKENKITIVKEGIKSKTYTPVSKELFNEIFHMDSAMFDAFNTHDLEKLKTTFSDSLEFYHDNGGLTRYTQTMENFRSLFDRNKNTGLRRDLVAGSLEVYPINNYGAIETGEHTFCHTENGKKDCGTFKFMHIWNKKDGQWKVTRIISYGH